MRVAVAGCGEVGLLFAGALKSGGHAVVLHDIIPSARALAFAEDAAVPLHTSAGPWLEDVDAAISCVVGSASLAVARAAFQFMPRGRVFADSTTCDPNEIRLAAGEAAEKGIDYADIAIMGAVSLTGMKTSLLCAGTGAARVLPLFKSIGAPITVVEGGKAGDSSALKILRSVFAKGAEALAIECFLAAEQQGVTDQLYATLKVFDESSLRDVLESYVRTHVVHAPRRLHEIEEAERQIRKANLPVDVLPGVRALFERTCRYIREEPIGDIPGTAKEAFAWLASNAEREMAEAK
jgi:3-hydroxyisobutyrate dehydrogenase-like beta-hydroxyacid dehydrogenase